jgi:DNA-binding IclR family transcriptional regulator
VVNIVGARAPLHITAVGKLFLLEDGTDAVRDYAARGRLVGHTRNTLTALPALEKELERVRKLGYALDNEEAEIGVKCIGAGIRDDTGALVAGLSISAPAERLKPQWAALVKDTADRISRSIGYRGQLAA